MTPTEKSTQNKRERERRWGGEVPEGREVHQESRDLLTGLRKCKPPPLPPPYTEREDPFSGAQIANGAEMKCLREPQVQAGVSAGPADGLFINCSTVHTVHYVEERDEANLLKPLVHTSITICNELHICPG